MTARPNDKTQRPDPSKWADEWVSKLVADPSKPPGAVVVTGFIGRSPDNKSVRLFLNADLQSWVDIPTDAILHREAIPKDTSPLGGSYLWVDRTAWSGCATQQSEHQQQFQQQFYQQFQQQTAQPQPAQPQQPQPPQTK